MENTEKPNALFNYFGEQALLQEKKTVFFCPYDVPKSIFKSIHEWIRTLVPGKDCVVCGNSTGVERYTLRLLLRKKISVILPLATVIPQCLEELNIGWKLTEQESVEMLDEALTERRILMVASTENVSVSVPTKRTMILRNYWMRWVGNRFILACNGKGGYFKHLLWKREVEVLDTNVVEETEPEVSQVCDDDYEYLLAV
jgi:hypothetical protein